jgi:hypothetical protein
MIRRAAPREDLPAFTIKDNYILEYREGPRKVRNNINNEWKAQF